MLKHIVLIRAREGTTVDQVEEAFLQLGALVGVFPGLRGFSGGLNNSPEGKAQGYTHGFIMTFDDAAARDAYLPHSEHQRVITYLRPWVQEVLVLDYEPLQSGSE